ncbi:agropine synthesis reductase [Rhodobacter sp. TJ_12]|uniref:SDR family NAD(P)-dependent oxidoreductase n=1 Tax=Rhodobacter sp. TJ_12 TaxID=2029399 RepID=UPI001CBF7D3C|nr:SDR family NAD(P)-dependent oxidoreductase [Rhodobacter sp. TJ_12]MBZ4021550.1 agropine synthesis reductase [Rhodobacter sp. TJ_12]
MSGVMLITGASRGIGLAVAREAQARGWFVSLGLRQPEHLPKGLDASAAETVAYEASAGGERDWVAGVLARHGRVDALVCCAGVLEQQSIVTEDEAAVQRLFEINAHAPRRLAAAAWAPLQAAGNGRIVILASLSGKRVKGKRSGLYAFSKFAAVGLAHALRHEGWADGIRATAICPGLVNTEMGTRAAHGDIDAATMTQPADLARLVLETVGQPATLSQAEISLNCQLDGLY